MLNETASRKRPIKRWSVEMALEIRLNDGLHAIDDLFGFRLVYGAIAVYYFISNF